MNDWWVRDGFVRATAVFSSHGGGGILVPASPGPDVLMIYTFYPFLIIERRSKGFNSLAVSAELTRGKPDPPVGSGLDPDSSVHSICVAVLPVDTEHAGHPRILGPGRSSTGDRGGNPWQRAYRTSHPLAIGAFEAVKKNRRKLPHGVACAL